MKAGKLVSLFAFSAAWFGLQSCVTDNPASYEGILGRSIRDRPEPPAMPSGGTAAGGSAGTPSGGTGAGKGGGPGGEGGMNEGGDAGMDGNIGGSTGATGGSTGATGGSTGATGGTGGGLVDPNPEPHPDFMPPCFWSTTTTGEEIKKGTPCTSEDPQLCYRPCGPNQVGWKTETCLAGVYAEGDCTFPTDQDYSCYSIPAVIDEVECGLTSPPFATDPCEAPLCTACNLAGFYQDTGSDVKEGFCVCREPDQGGVRRWTCASETAWPCPFANGC